jgi:hypothetical protein
MMGRNPEPDDLIVPLSPKAAARRRTRTGDAFRGQDYSGKRWREEDLPILGWRHRRHYDMGPRLSRSRSRTAPTRTWSRRA